MLDFLASVPSDILLYVPIVSMGGLCILAVVHYENKIRRLQSEGKKMTGSLRQAHVRTILSDYVSDAMDKAFEDDKISEEEYLFWCNKLASSGLADLRHKPRPDVLKIALRNKRIDEGKPTTLAEAQTTNGSSNVHMMVDALRKKLAG